jgi:hypothetical protein
VKCHDLQNPLALAAAHAKALGPRFAHFATGGGRRASVFRISPYLPQDLSTDIGAEAVDKVLAIIASSMLFSLSTMVTAYGAATSNVTPRATRLIMEDSTTQNVLAAFIGSFLYSIVAISDVPPLNRTVFGLNFPSIIPGWEKESSGEGIRLKTALRLARFVERRGFLKRRSATGASAMPA